MVLVMDNGLAAEWGRPATLLDNPKGTFTSEAPFLMCLTSLPSKALPSCLLCMPKAACQVDLLGLLVGVCYAVCLWSLVLGFDNQACLLCSSVVGSCKLSACVSST